jgi:hypothetical protein
LVTVQLLYVPQGQLGQSVVVVSHLQTAHYIHRVARAAHREGRVGLLRPIALVRHSAVVAASWPWSGLCISLSALLLRGHQLAVVVYKVCSLHSVV